MYEKIEKHLSNNNDKKTYYSDNTMALERFGTLVNIYFKIKFV
jgi:hypothetical protein